ncbi:MAG: hypothetical protein JW994_04815 [Candidatus Omnitrophica bacterium]|nr:hypothetical protein [Candidatus Omnitrophota bacterium]
MKKNITVIDLGSDNIAAASALIDKKGGVSLLALGNSHSDGITAGVITDINKATEEIASLLSKLKDGAARNIKSVIVSTRGADIQMETARGMIALSRTPREVTKRDVKRCLDIAAMVKLAEGRTVLDKVVKRFIVDGVDYGVKTPIGHYGIKLEVEVFVATTRTSKINNIEKCVDHAGFILDDIRLSGPASASSVLDNAEKEKGVLLMDIGEVLIEAIVLRKGALRYFRVFKKGTAYIRDNKERVDGKRLVELLRSICSEITLSGEAFTSIVITGSGALLDSVIEEAENIFGLPARMGIVRKTRSAMSSQDAILHTATIGIIENAAQERRKAIARGNPLQKLASKVLDIYENYF